MQMGRTTSLADVPDAALLPGVMVHMFSSSGSFRLLSQFVRESFN